MSEVAAESEEGPGAIDLALRLTLAMLLLQPVGAAWLRPAFLGLAVAGLVVPGAQRWAALWAALAFLAAARVWMDWPLADNHAYLLGYWCLAAAIALRASDPTRVLASNARWLIALAFGFASLWKIALSPDFLSGDFLRFLWITDDRFADAAAVFGGMDETLRKANRDFLAGAPNAGSGLVEPRRFVLATRAATFWTVGIEAGVALSFLGWRTRWLRRVRDPLLLAFCVTTYAIAPVAGFGWLLLAMGVAQSDAHRPRIRVLYIAAFGLLVVYETVPWLGWLADTLGLAAGR